MLSGPPDSAGTARDKTDVTCWLPEFDAPVISLDLSPLSQPDAVAAEAHRNDNDNGDGALVTQPAEPESASGSTPRTGPKDEAAAAPLAAASRSGSDVYANLSAYAGMVASDKDDHQSPPANAADAQSIVSAKQLAPSPALSHPSQLPSPCSPATGQLASDDHAAKLLDEFPDVPDDAGGPNSLGVDFDFHTDPVIDAISTSPLFAIAADAQSQPQLHTDAQPQPQTDAPVQSRPPVQRYGSQQPSNRSKSRRASIAGLLMRRASKYVDATLGSTSNSDAAGSQADLAAKSSASIPSGHQVPESDVHVAAALASGDGSIADAASSNKLPKTSTHAVSACKSADDSRVEDESRLAPDAQSQATGSDASDKSAEAAVACDEPGKGSGSPSIAENASVEDGDSVEDGSDNEQKLATPPQPAEEPRRVEKRSSRILSGFTRKVNHVRQTTSMVLRRSVGSRLSIVPRKSLEGLNHAAHRQPDATDALTNQGIAAIPQDDPPQYTSAEDIVATPAHESSSDEGQKAAADKISEGSASSAVSSPAADAATPAAKDADTDNNAEMVPSGDAESAASDAAASEKDGLDSKGTFSQRLGVVRRGTNEAVRNSVTRMKHMFTSKRPPLTA
ncbi:hypothetical protein GGF46_002389 [Coemansia sp. RSA 552]|nr:hypothetical protein GGF46_002389 [Coemansia sp. RSA 552]